MTDLYPHSPKPRGAALEAQIAKSEAFISALARKHSLNPYWMLTEPSYPSGTLGSPPPNPAGPTPARDDHKEQRMLSPERQNDANIARLIQLAEDAGEKAVEAAGERREGDRAYWSGVQFGLLRATGVLQGKG